ncbi:MAG: DNA polymerase III subunit delta [Clostridia bacterium]|nr:DNA polymerase III subunit delta [Clostridia bacterium]
MAVKESDVMKLKREIKEKGISGAYLFYGEELYLRDLYIDKIRGVIPEDGFEEFNLITLDGKTAGLETMADAIESYPMMSEKKLVIVRDSGIFKKAREEEVRFWTEELKNLPDYCVLLFIEDSVDKRSAVYKVISKNGTAVDFAYLRPYELTAWVQGEVLKAKKKMSKNVIEYFVSVCQDGLINLKNELDKLLCACDEEITEFDVKRMVSKSLNVQVFDLSDCIMQKDTDRAFTILQDLKTTRESAFTILYLLNSMFDKMLLSKLMLADGAPVSEVERRLGLPPFIAKKYYNGAKGFSEEFLTERVKRVPELDLAIKQGKIAEWDALYKFIFEAIGR